MSVDERAEKAIGIIEGQVKELEEIVYTSPREFDFALEKLTRWKSRTVKLLYKNVNPGEAKKLAEIGSGLVSRNPVDLFRFKKEKYRAFLEILADELESNPEAILSAPEATNEDETTVQISESVSTRGVFIVHGHDDANLLRLEKLLRDRWNLEPIIIRSKAGKGRTLIEKFEGEAKNAGFAMALLTPDDVVKVDDTEYAQARPNVTFELGWFCGRLGRDRTCILFKQGTKIHSDLGGINRIEFRDSVKEKVLEIEDELDAAGLVGH